MEAGEKPRTTAAPPISRGFVLTGGRNLLSSHRNIVRIALTTTPYRSRQSSNWRSADTV